MTKTPIDRILWAITIVAFGSLLLAQNLGLIDQNIWMYAWKFWPIVFIIPGISSIFAGRYFWGVILTLAGSAMIFSHFTEIDLWGIIWPVLIIAVGVSMIFKPKVMEWSSNGSSTDADTLNDEVIFGSLDKRITSKKFKGGRVEVIFGGGKLDLQDVELASDYAKLELTAIFGGIEVLVDTDKYKVVGNGTGILGGWENRPRSGKAEKPVLEITGEAIFGGVEIK